MEQLSVSGLESEIMFWRREVGEDIERFYIAAILNVLFNGLELNGFPLTLHKKWPIKISNNLLLLFPVFPL